MINGQLGQWINEAQQHWEHMATAGAAIKEVLSWPDLVRYAIVATAASVITTQITITELKGELKAIRGERDIIVQKRNEQVAEIRKDVDALQALALTQTAILARLEARVEDRRR